MNFQSLKLFLDLAESCSFVRTANKNHVTASTLSRQIQRLEEETGQVLFFRDNRQVGLTLAGKQFLPFAERCWSDWQALLQQYALSQGELEGELKLFCSVTATYSHLPVILADFRQRYPKIEIKLHTGDPASAVAQVLSMQADLSLAGESEHLPEQLLFHPIDQIPLTLIAPRVACLATQLLRENPIDWQTMPFILPEEGPARKRIDQWFRMQKIRHPQIYATVAGHEAIVPMVALGCGVALIPEVVVKHSPMHNQISILDLPNPVSAFQLGICTQKHRLQEPIIQAFWQTALSHYRETDLGN